MSIKLERDEYHSRTLALTGNDTLDEIVINYTGNATAHKGSAIDGEVIPAIVNAVNSAPALLEALTLARDALHQADYDEIDGGKLEAHIRLTINAATKGGD